MEALVLEEKGKISIREVAVTEAFGPDDVKIALHTVGVCGSDVHYYTRGSIGPFVVKEPMILGHEASGTVIEVGDRVTNLNPGDRVCMEPGVPNPMSRVSLEGKYNLDPAIVFWATPPIHGVTRTSVVHPAAFTFRLPDTIGHGEAAMVEPLAVGMHAATKARIKPGDVAVVTGAGTIGVVTALAALAGGCSRVLITDVQQPKLDIAASYESITPANVTKENALDKIMEMTNGWGADHVFEASGSEKAVSEVFDYLKPGGCAVLVGMPSGPVPVDVVKAQAKEVRMETIFRYANVYPKALALLGSGKINVKPLITDTYSFKDGVAAYEYATHPDPSSVKIQIEMV